MKSSPQRAKTLNTVERIAMMTTENLWDVREVARQIMT
jgi:hypothetical protein